METEDTKYILDLCGKFQLNMEIKLLKVPGTLVVAGTFSSRTIKFAIIRILKCKQFVINKTKSSNFRYIESFVLSIHHLLNCCIL